MKKYILRKLLLIIPIMLLVSMVTFGLTTMARSDPAQIVLSAAGIKVSPEALEMKREELGLNRPAYVRYLDWLWDLLHLDFGESYITGLPIRGDLMFRFVRSLRLSVVSLLFLVLLSVPLGVAASVSRNPFWDYTARAMSFISAAFPAFCFGLLLIYIFGVRLKVLSVIETETGLGMILPAFTAAFAHAGTYIRLVSTSMESALSQPYIQAARAKGLPRTVVLFRHAMKNALVPLVTRFGMTVGSFIGGFTMIEIVFSYRGMGTYVMDAINMQDYPVIQAYVILMAALVSVLNLVSDLIYVAIDPRLQLD